MHYVIRYCTTSQWKCLCNGGRSTMLLLARRLTHNLSNNDSLTSYRASGQSWPARIAKKCQFLPLPSTYPLAYTTSRFPFIQRSFASQQPSQLERYRDRLITIPNILSMTRIILSPYLSYLLLQGQFEATLMLFAAAGLTDWLDGWIARRFNSQKSLVGTVLDPIADKILMCTLTVSLSAASLLPWPITAIILSRDVGLVIFAFYYRFKTLPPPITFNRFFNTRHAPAEIHPLAISKLNTGLQLSLIFMSIAAPVFDFINHPMLQMLWFSTAATTILSGLSYTRSVNFVKHLKKSEG